MISQHIESRYDRHNHIRPYGATATAIGVGVTALVSAASTGLTMYAQQQQAESAASVANYNYQVQAQNAAINARAAQMQATWRAQAADANRQNQLNNATALDAQARAREAQSREEQSRLRQENEARLAALQARYGKNGVTSEGSPIVQLAESAKFLELAVQDGSYQAEMEARALGRQAMMERAGADSSAFDKAVADYEYAAASAGHTLALNDAQSSLSSGLARADAARMSSYTTLLSGMGDLMDIGTKEYKWK